MAAGITFLCPDCNRIPDFDRNREVKALAVLFGVAENARICRCGGYLVREGEILDPLRGDKVVGHTHLS